MTGSSSSVEIIDVANDLSIVLQSTVSMLLSRTGVLASSRLGFIGSKSSLLS